MAKFHSKMDGKKYTVDDCKFDLDRRILLPSETRKVTKHVISLYQHPQGRVLSKSTQLCRRYGKNNMPKMIL